MLPKLSRILLVTDFSDTANRAVPYAYAIAERGAEVHLVHVIEHQDIPNPLYAHYSFDELFDPEKQKQAIALVQKHLKGLVPKDAADKDIVTRVAAALYPAVAEGLVEEARKRRCKAIVIGSHGRTGAARLLMGSVAEAVVRSASVPVLVVPMRAT